MLLKSFAKLNEAKWLNLNQWQAETKFLFLNSKLFHTRSILIIQNLTTCNTYTENFHSYRSHASHILHVI